ncbi:MAG: hypothetical protein U0270_26335 [Labilithrix sp.]
MSSERWLGEAHINGRVVARIGRLEDRLIAEWLGIGRLEVSKDGSDAHFDPLASADPRQVEKIREGAVLLLLRSLHGKIGLHGSAIALGNAALVFVGQAGAGKSTLAAAFCKEQGASLLADDAVALEHDDSWSVLASERLHFLDAAALAALSLPSVGPPLATQKHAITAPRLRERATLKAIMSLCFDPACNTPALRRLGAIDGLQALVPQTIRFAIDEPSFQRREFEELSNLLITTPVFELTRPPSFRHLDATIELIHDIVVESA